MLPKILYVISGTLWAIELLPQLVKTYKRKTVGDISIFFPLICFISFLIFFIASYLVKNWILIASHTFPLICNVIFLIQVIIYGKRQKSRP